MKTCYVMTMTVADVYERTARVNFQKDGTYDELKEGWWVRCDGCSSVGPFDAAPDLKPGDKLKVTFEKAT